MGRTFDLRGNDSGGGGSSGGVRGGGVKNKRGHARGGSNDRRSGRVMTAVSMKRGPAYGNRKKDNARKRAATSLLKGAHDDDDGDDIEMMANPSIF
jgi:hypothetical protein